MRKYCLLSIVALVIFTSCQQKEVEYDNSIPAVETSAVINNVSDTINPAAVNAATPEVQVAPATQPSNVATNNGALNPPHGQPNHRCDIEVGAPLNSAPQNAQAAPSIQPVASPILPSANAAGAVTINPPHGQPGHDCAVPVGQPLKG